MFAAVTDLKIVRPVAAATFAAVAARMDAGAARPVAGAPCDAGIGAPEGAEGEAALPGAGAPGDAAVGATE